MPISAEKLNLHFWSRVEKTDKCWIWHGDRSAAGYGLLHRDKRRQYVHRFSFVLAKGPIPEGLEIDHLCNNPPCLNPDHLRAVTHRENMARSYPGAFNAAKTQCPRGHVYTAENVYLYKGRRNCRVCTRTRSAEGKRRRRAERSAVL